MSSKPKMSRGAQQRAERRAAAAKARAQASGIVEPSHVGGEVKPEEDPVFVAATWVRNKGKLDDVNGVVQGKRVEAIDGVELVELLQSPRYNGMNKQLPVSSKEEALALAGKFMKKGYFQRAAEKEGTEKNYREYIELVLNPGSFAEDALYIWTLPASKFRLYLQSGLMVFGGIALCMVKVWPLWIKVVVWWLSLIYLVSTISLIILRLIIFAFFWVIGFKGMWLLPNLLDEDIDVLATFTPLFAQEEKYKRRSKKQREADQAAAKRKAEEAIANDGDEDKGKLARRRRNKSKQPKEEKEFIEGRGWEFGAANLAVILAVAFWGCKHMGMFDTENIPEFLVSQHELWKTYPSLAPPGTDLDALDREDDDTEAATMTDSEAAAAAAAAAASQQPVDPESLDDDDELVGFNLGNVEDYEIDSELDATDEGVELE